MRGKIISKSIFHINESIENETMFLFKNSRLDCLATFLLNKLFSLLSLINLMSKWLSSANVAGSVALCQNGGFMGGRRTNSGLDVKNGLI